MNTPYHIVRPAKKRVPVVVSCPHSGTEIPPDIAKLMHPEVVAQLTDTDWFVNELYDFAPSLGITLVHARYSRYVIDLNRDPAGRRLYQDQRQETSLVPLHTFAGEPLYLAEAPSAADIKRRLDLYYAPYHAQLGKLLSELRVSSPQVLLFDAHSVRRHVPSIQPGPFPDLILGDQLGKTADAALTEAALSCLQRSNQYQLRHNTPFMGGYLVRRFGQPERGVHALQLEMAKDLYMNDADSQRDPIKQAALSLVLRKTLETLVLTTKQLAAR